MSKICCFFFCIFFDNQFRIYKPSYVPDVSLTIRTVKILQDCYFKANSIEIFLGWLIIFKTLLLYFTRFTIFLFI